MTPLKQKILKEIARSGPMPLPRYMALCLSDPEHGYYMQRQPFGRGGDFITAPEISQMFGELIGLWIGDHWARCGQPQDVCLVELGPGRGTLMRDCRRALSKVPGWPSEAPIHLVETSPALRGEQAQHHPDAQWHDEFDTISPSGPRYVIANELFDALPIQQWLFIDSEWHQRALEANGDALAWTSLPDDVPTTPLQPTDGDIMEMCPEGEALAKQIAQSIATQGGAALIIDYGYSQTGFGDTFQAVANHSYVDPLDTPGEADLTAHVNFVRLSDVGKDAGAAVSGPVTQGAFLLSLGLPLRARALGGAALRDAARLADPGAMGDLFKVLAYTQPGSPLPAGFAP